MKRHEITTEGENVVLRIEANTKAGLVSAMLLALADSMGVLPKTEDVPMPDITAERDFSAQGTDANSTLKAVLAKVLEEAGKNKEAHIDAKLTLVTDKKIEGQLVAVKTGLIEGNFSRITGFEGPEKQDDKIWHVKILLA